MKLVRHPVLRAVFDGPGAIVAGLSVLLLASCSREPAGAGKVLPAPVPVLAAQAMARDIPVELQSIGTVQPYSTVSIRPQITGPLIQVHFQEGQEVIAGDLLFTIDPRSLDAALNQAQANLRRDEAQLLNTRMNFERTRNLFVSKIASQQDYDTAEAGFQAAQGTVLADAAAVTNAQVNLSYTIIRAPISGRTGNLAVKAGNVVKATDDVLVTITQIRPIFVAFAVPEHQLPVIRRRSAEGTLPVRAYAPSETNHVAWGELTFIDNSVDINTGTILLKGTFANSNSLLWPGQFVQTTLTISNLVQVTVVPSQAVQSGQNGEFVFVVKPDMTVEPRAVATGVTHGGVRVIQSGVKTGETVVTDGQLRLSPGAKVNIKTQEPSGVSTNGDVKS